VGTTFPPSLEVAFDASVRYGPDNATPQSGALGYVVVRGATPLFECSRSVNAVVSNTALEYRALLEAVAAVDRAFDRVASLHVRGDADAVLRACDSADEMVPNGRVERRRVARIREHVADVPDVTYRSVPSSHNERAHALASAGHDR
jgi:ribonuclease HI